MKNGKQPDPNVIHPIPGYDKEIYVKPTITSPNIIVGDELAMAQLEIRSQKEASAESRVQAAYEDKYDFWTMIGAKREVAEMLSEEEPRSIRDRVRRKEYEKQRAERRDTPQKKKNKDRGWER